jgi:DNA (cytosine-5)-methyltransferase 1
MSRPRLLDLFCGAGGAAMGYHRAGFDIVGVDIDPQPRYPFEFYRANALTFPLEEFDVIHASPPCQVFSNMRSIRKLAHLDYLTPTRERLKNTRQPWVIENVVGAPMRADVRLCGCLFRLEVKRHRLFEFSRPIIPPPFIPPCFHGHWPGGRPIGVYGHPGRKTRLRSGPSHEKTNVDDWRRGMGIGWMTVEELSQAIPPAYTEWVGARLMQMLPPAQR